MTGSAQEINNSVVWGCVLIGGASSRMGRPKHLIVNDGLTWLETTIEKLRKKVKNVVISGKGDIPPSLKDIPVIPDDPGMKGPMAGVLSVMRWNPEVSWLVVGCDQPEINVEAIEWLLALRKPEIKAVLPVLREGGQVEPLLAYYDASCRAYLEEIVERRSFRIWEMKDRPGVLTPTPPAHLHRSWLNINTPDELAQ